LDVLSQQIRLGLGPNTTMVERHWMFYTLANIHHEIITRDGLPLAPVSGAPFKISHA
jgi:hypothetical protein